MEILQNAQVQKEADEAEIERLKQTLQRMNQQRPQQREPRPPFRQGHRDGPRQPYQQAGYTSQSSSSQGLPGGGSESHGTPDSERQSSSASTDEGNSDDRTDR